MTHRMLTVILLAACLLAASLSASPRTTVCFTPGQDCTDAIVQALREAKHSLLVQAYSFTSVPIARALLDAHTRGVEVQVILDKSQRTEKYSSADFLANQGVETMIDADHAISHNKVIGVSADLLHGFGRFKALAHFW
jgi:phosphatidylserine/phosphatidylglycerophosphate/cardiolipin synthase-like enzyme